MVKRSLVVSRWSLVIGICLVIGHWSLVIGPTGAEVPQQISFQGRLVDAGGNPIVSTTTVGFGIYDVESGGTAIWSSSQSVTPDSNGFFSTSLDFTPARERTPLSFDSPYWIEIQVGGATLSPRQPLTSSPYALRTKVAEELASGDQTVNGNLTVTGTASASMVIARRGITEGRLADGLYGVRGSGQVGVQGFGANQGVFGMTTADNATGILAESRGANSRALQANAYGNNSFAGWFRGPVIIESAAASGGGLGTLEVRGQIIGREGVRGEGREHGVYGRNTESNGEAIYGYSEASGSAGIRGFVISNNSYGVLGVAQGSNSYGVRGEATRDDSYAGYFRGKVHITNVLHLVPQSSAPSSASEGDIYVDINGHIYCYLHRTTTAGVATYEWVQLDN